MSLQRGLYPITITSSYPGVSVFSYILSSFQISLSPALENPCLYSNHLQYKKMYAQGNALIRKFYMCTESVKTCLFRSYCSSLYTCQLWTSYKVESLRKMCVAYNNVFRLLCNEPRNCSASHMFVSRCLPTCKMLIRKSIYRFMKTTLNSTNDILYNIVNSDTIYASYIWQHW